MTRALIISVCFHDGRYHGTGPWPPAPARLFQALVAAAAEGGDVPANAQAALAWLETLPPPEITAPIARAGQGYRNYVPNNDLDAKNGDPKKVADIRTPKQIRPYLFNAAKPLLYCWRFSDDPENHARTIATITDRLYQLGRGVDMAWAKCAIFGKDEADKHIHAHGGAHSRPAPGNGNLLPCPAPGSLISLINRHKALEKRLTTSKKGRSMKTAFTQPPKPRFQDVAYDSPPTRLLFDIRNLATRRADFHPTALTDVAKLVETVRDKVADRLKKALPDQGTEIDRVFGRVKAMGNADKAQRIRIIPLPSVGHPHAESSIRRILVDVPPHCPLPSGDIHWAFAGVTLSEQTNPHTGEIVQDIQLTDTDNPRMTRHYGLNRGARIWRTITPAALPEKAARRRIDPSETRNKPKGGGERGQEESRAAHAVRQALRHAGIDTATAQIHVQREPFHAKGARAEGFAARTRFSKHQLWHVEIAFEAPVKGPLILGNGRYLGLGLMAPMPDARRRVAAFAIEGSPPPAKSHGPIIHALRRALMALDRDVTGALSPLFSGHKPDGRPAGNGGHEHVFLTADHDEDTGTLSRLYVIRPDMADPQTKLDHGDKDRFEQVTNALESVRAGHCGVLALRPLPDPENESRLFGQGRVWVSNTPYRATRHPKRRDDRRAFMEQDVRRELHRRGLPEPADVTILSCGVEPETGPYARIRLRFAVAVSGPLLLGKGAHRGDGTFIRAE
ncbi:type I-G CRISPR-associated protein Csb2 [Yunchengibacter salinarum]|uniref:type I-G CRISPR-associated protein Csb2 n=1 Tax=Yunchengibacter salinarum TaxID=3133399 RepID=UPI0035B61299